MKLWMFFLILILLKKNHEELVVTKKELQDAKQNMEFNKNDVINVINKTIKNHKRINFF